jgi:hypothetical protein
MSLTTTLLAEDATDNGTHIQGYTAMRTMAPSQPRGMQPPWGSPRGPPRSVPNMGLSEH